MKNKKVSKKISSRRL